MGWNMAKRTDPEDTIDTAIHFLAKLQAEGWGLVNLEQSIDYAKVGKHKLPYAATVTLKLIPR